MSDLPPQLSPEEIEEFRQERRRRMEEVFRRRYPGLEIELGTERVARPVASESLAPHPTVSATKPSITGWITTALQSVTLAMLLGGMFWLGSLKTTVDTNAQKLDKLNDGIVGISKDSLSNRMIAIETKIDEVNKKLESASQTRQPTRR